MPHWVEILLWVAGSLTALGVIWRQGLKPLLKAIRAGIGAYDEIKLLAPIIRTMAEEFKPNDGASMRDRIDQNYQGIQDLQAAVEHRITTHDHYHEGWEERLTRLEIEDGL